MKHVQLNLNWAQMSSFLYAGDAHLPFNLDLRECFKYAQVKDGCYWSWNHLTLEVLQFSLHLTKRC